MDDVQRKESAAESLSTVERLREHIESSSSIEIEEKLKLLALIRLLDEELSLRLWNSGQVEQKLRGRLEECVKKEEETMRALNVVSSYFEAQLEMAQRSRRFDRLTGCFEKTYFLRDILVPRLKLTATDRRNKDRRSAWLVLWMIDIGHFKATNDSLGHVVGDKVLKRFGRILRISVRFKAKGDYPVRYGGDEFLVLMTNTEMSMVKEVVDRFRERVKTRKWWGIHPLLENDFPPRPDIGVACLRVSSLSDLSMSDDSMYEVVGQRWIAAADKLMYRAKAEGEIFLRCYDYDHRHQDLVEVEPEIFKLELAQDRRHQ